jgi:hypothetical protein
MTSPCRESACESRENACLGRGSASLVHENAMWVFAVEKCAFPGCETSIRGSVSAFACRRVSPDTRVVVF